jgi:periplasmic protein TonB
MKVFCLIILINALCCTFCFGQQTDTAIFLVTEIMPTFKYDTCASGRSSLENYFMDNYKMPAILIDNGYIGSIYVEFIVERDGSISNYKVIRGIDEPLDKSIIETFKTMPKWIPGKYGGKCVRTRLTLPVSIRWLYGKIE